MSDAFCPLLVCKAHMPFSDSSSPLFDSNAKQITQDISGQGCTYIWHVIFWLFVSYWSCLSLRALYGCIFLGHYSLFKVAETESEGLRGCLWYGPSTVP